MAYESKGSGNSFNKAVTQEPTRFIEGSFKENPNISDFSEFKNAYHKYMNSPNGENAPSTEQDIIDLFESKECKERMKENVSSDELDKLYGDGLVVRREAISNKRMVKIVRKKVPVKAYVTKKGKSTKASFRGEKLIWKPVHIKFLKAQKVKGLTPKKAMEKYNKQFSSNPRTYDSVKSKFYRS